LRLVFESGFADTVSFTARTDHRNAINVTKVNPSIIFGMIVKVVNFYFFDGFGVRLVLQISNPGLNPVGAGMEGVDSVINLDLFARFPLGEDAVRAVVNEFIIFTG
jgi:hypothetical protein